MDGMIYTRWEMTQKYETLVTPVDWAFNYLWIPILILQGCFTIAQMLPYYRARPIIATGTRYFFFYTVLLQVVYTLCYSFRLFVISFVAVVLALISLLSLLFSQINHGSLSTQHGRRSWMEYFIFRLPFILHLGWMILMAVDHFSLLFRRFSGDTALQLASDIVALGVLLPVASYALYHEAGPDWVVPIVILWYYVRSEQNVIAGICFCCSPTPLCSCIRLQVGVACRLAHPSDAMVDMYGLSTIKAVFVASWMLAVAVACCLIPSIVVSLAREFCTINVIELD
jgi:hypothetical protein